MKTSDTSEQGLEAIIVASLVEEAGYARGTCGTTIGSMPLIGPNCGNSSLPPSRIPARRSASTAKDLNAPDFCAVCRARSPGAAWWMCCAPASGTARPR